MTSTILRPRLYQRQMLDAFETDWENDLTRLAGVLPTGGGKTVVFAHMAKEFIDLNAGRQVLVLVHTDELVNQAFRKVLDVAPHLNVGIVKGPRGDYLADVIIGSVQSLRSEARRAKIRHVGLIIVDECHHATAATYKAILAHYGNVRVAGFTATLSRSDGGDLGKVWQKVTFQRDIAWMVRKRYLVNPMGKRVQVPDLNLRGVKSTKADFRDGELGDAMATSLAPGLIASAILEHAPDRKTLAFFPTVASAEVFAETFRDYGIDAKVIHGGMTLTDRRETLAWHKRGSVLVNCMILTEGYDDPEVDCIVVGRPTKSKGLYIQIVGRGLRVDPKRDYEAQDCLILDVVGMESMDLRSLADLSEKPVKEPRDGQSLLEIEDEFDGLERPEADPEHFYEGPVEVREFDPLAAQSSKVWLETAKGVRFVSAGKDGYVFLIEEGEGWSVVWASKSRTTSYYMCEDVCDCKSWKDCTSNKNDWFYREVEDKGEACEDGMHEYSVPPIDGFTTNAYAKCEASHSKGVIIPQIKCDHTPLHKDLRGGRTEHVNLPLDMAMTFAEDLAVDMGADVFETYTKKKAPWRRGAPSDKAKSMARNLGIDPENMKAGELSDRIGKVLASRRIDPIAERLVKK